MSPLPVEWPSALAPLIEGITVVPEDKTKRRCSIDVDVDAQTLLLLNLFEAHARHRQVQIPLPDGAGCLRGEMNTLVGLGNATDPTKIGKVRISFHNLTADDCSDDLT